MKKVKEKVMMLTFLLITICSHMNAQDKDNPWAVGFGVNIVDIRTPDDFKGVFKDYLNGSIEDLNVIPAISRITVSRYLKNGFSLQLSGSLNKIEKGYGYDKDALKLNDMFLAVDAKVKYDLNNFLGETGWFDPFVLLGGGYAKISDVGEGKFAAGWGFNTWFKDNIGLSFQSDYNHGLKSTGKDYFQHSVGVIVKFGGSDTDGDGINDNGDECPNVFGLAKYKGCPDTDGDGIIDSKDNCPNKAGLVIFNGCPDTDNDGIADTEDDCPNVKGIKANKGCPDTDGDGLVDKKDNCPQEAGPIENKGCPWPDTDGDGVLDRDDECISEVGPASNKGCPVITKHETAQLRDLFSTVYFETGKNSFKSETYSKLDAATKIMRKYKNGKYLISGHTDNVGSDKLNLELSSSRANAVKDYLISKGISSNKLSSEGFGEDMPIASNRTKTGRAKNRRVEIKLTN